MTALASLARRPPVGAKRRAVALVRAARARERAGCAPDAIDCYEAAIAVAEQCGAQAVLAEALRRLAVLRHHRNQSAQARDLCRRSYEVAQAMGDDLLTAEALNSLGCLDVATGSLDDAHRAFLAALKLGRDSADLRARVERNLGIVANIHGDLDEAVARYARSLDESHSAGDEQGCALAYHNLGLVSADREQWDVADRYFAQSYAIAERTGNVHLQGLCLVNHADVHLARRRFEDAQRNAESALAIFNRLGTPDEKSGAYRVIGVVYRETGRAALAEARLRSAIELAVAAGSVLNEAEASQELALLYQSMGRNREALALLNAAHGMFRRLDARRDLVHVDGKVADLEATYLAVVQQWGQSIESSDSYTFGHCERVAQNAVAVAKELGLDEQAQTTIRLGAYLHDVGKVKVPHEILNKPGSLSDEEFAVIQMHPIWGVELLVGMELPWDLKPIIRWHHERYDGTGYPDRLRGDEIPISAQIVGIVDVYDALTTTRPYRPALAPTQALSEMTKRRGAWSAPVLEAFLRALLEASRERGRRGRVHHGAGSERAA